MCKDTKRRTNIASASKAPPIAPSIIAKRLCSVCFFRGKSVTCGASIEELDERSLHDIVEKERHKFPDVLHSISALAQEET